MLSVLGFLQTLHLRHLSSRTLNKSPFAVNIAMLLDIDGKSDHF